MSSYESFLTQKAVLWDGQPIPTTYKPHKNVFPFQVAVIEACLNKGRYCVFADTGLGKTVMEVELARTIADYAEKPVLIVAPLGVAHQTVQQASDVLDYRICYAKSQDDVLYPVVTTNYERLDKFDPSKFSAILLDESSILKGFKSKTKQKLIDDWAGVPYRFAFTATPSPNDLDELGNHSEFLGVLAYSKVKSQFFIEDDKGLRLKKPAHAGGDFYRWVASWSISLRLPSDIGDFSDEGYVLPPIEYHKTILDTEFIDNSVGQQKLMFTGLGGIMGRSQVRKMTIGDKVAKISEIVNNSDEQWLVWSYFNKEADLLEATIDGACQVSGKDGEKSKLDKFKSFVNGDCRVLVTKPKIAGFGLNFQHSHNMIFCGLNDSFEMFYQMVRRQYRFGQKHKVNVHIVLSEMEQEILKNVLRKGEIAKTMSDELIAQIKNAQELDLGEYKEGMVSGSFMGNDYQIMLGDSCDRLKELADNSIDMMVYSPPFDSLYTYSPSPRDLGNSKTETDFIEHYRFIVRELLRVLKPGRIAAVHVQDIARQKGKDGYIGMRDFSGEIIRLHEEEGWYWDGRIPIDKNQQAQSIRTNNPALAMNSFERDRKYIRPALPDYILKFRKPGTNEVPINDRLTLTANQKADWYLNMGYGFKRMARGKTEYSFVLTKPPENGIILPDNVETYQIKVKTPQEKIIATYNHTANGKYELSSKSKEQLQYVNNSLAVDTPDNLVKFPEWLIVGMSREKWIEYANPIWPAENGDRCADVGFDTMWYGIEEGDTLQRVVGKKALTQSRGVNDEKHVCPLQLSTIERCIRLWSKHGDTVLTPFMGIGSEVYQALRMNRNAIGIELKDSYFNFAVKNMGTLQNIESQTSF